MTLPTTIYSFPAYLPRFSSTDKPAKLKFHQYARATLLSNRGRDHNCDGRRTVEIHKLGKVRISRSFLPKLTR
ncbi:DUF2686 family protein [Escherichia coli]|nr:DUF2686 family protein [Escherichia coli]MCH7104006.1 DUF2686 family protein [Escherichia coli]